MLSEYSVVIDIDGTLCPIKSKEQSYGELVPYPEMMSKLNELKAQGVKIILYTSRNMNSYNGNLGLINKNTADIMLQWLKKWEVPYDEIYFGKPWPGHKGFYVDDRAVRPRELLELDFDELANICDRDKL